MEQKKYLVEAMTPFSESMLWNINRNYYHEAGLDAWNSGKVPHHMTSNSMVGKTYAYMIYGLLMDLSIAGKVKEEVVVMELGAGHGRLCFHILRHLDELIAQTSMVLPPYKYILSDISEKNLDFFTKHEQFGPYFISGKLDVAYYDAVEGDEIVLRYSGTSIAKGQLVQPMVVLANYFFDSIPCDLFRIRRKGLSLCNVAIETTIDPATMDAATLLGDIELRYASEPITLPYYHETVADDILEGYRNDLEETFVFYPKTGINCLERLRVLSTQGLLVLTMDKGNHLLETLDKKPTPDYITHGSFSWTVNYHAFAAYAKATGGMAIFPSASNYNLELGCLLMLDQAESYKETIAAYSRHIDAFGPDDFFGITRFVYPLADKLGIRDMIILLRLSAYDSTFFFNLLPWFKQAVKQITFHERARIAETLTRTWHLYFIIDEPYDLAFEMAGIFFDLGYYEDAYTFFGHSLRLYGNNEDGFYNQALCLYQMNQDLAFFSLIDSTMTMYPGFGKMEELRSLVK